MNIHEPPRLKREPAGYHIEAVPAEYPSPRTGKVFAGRRDPGNIVLSDCQRIRSLKDTGLRDRFTELWREYFEG
jgi:hypothetical protein